MITRLSAPVSVTLHYDHHFRQAKPVSVRWDGRDYPLVQLGYHHSYREGRTLIHIFSVASANLFFRLKLNTDTLHWLLEGVGDAEAN